MSRSRLNCRPLYLLLALALLVAGCSDEDGEDAGADGAETDTGGQPDVVDGSDDTTVDSGDAPDNGGNETVAREPSDPETEWPDCPASCRHSEPRTYVDLRGGDSSIDAYRGVIDDQEHTYFTGDLSAELIGADRDYLDVAVSSRQMLEVIVEPADGSTMWPVFWIGSGTNIAGDPEGSAVWLFGGGSTEEARRARLVVAGPYVNDTLPLFIGVEPVQNNEIGPGAADFGSYVGGEDIAYLMRFRTWDLEEGDDGRLALTELGELTPANSTASVEGAVLEQPGDIHYYRFMAQATAQATVTATRTGSSDFVLYLIGTKTIGGDLTIERMAFDDAGSGTVTVGPNAFRPCFDGGDADCSAETGEFIFAVTDWSGFGGNDFSYDVSVNVAFE